MEIILFRVTWHGVLLSFAGHLQSPEIKLVSVTFPRDFGQNIFVVIVTKSTAKFIVIHILFGLPLAPHGCDVFGFLELELAVGRVPLPADDVLIAGAIEELQEELPQLQVTIFFVREK